MEILGKTSRRAILFSLKEASTQHQHHHVPQIFVLPCNKEGTSHKSTCTWDIAGNQGLFTCVRQRIRQNKVENHGRK